MKHNHQHTHDNQPVKSLNRIFLTAITLNISFVLAEFAAGFWYNSLGLISDAGHNLSDVASLLLAMLAFKLSKVHANKKYTYGYKKSTILVSLLNAIILLIAVGVILHESIEKIFNPAPIEGIAIAGVAGIGVIINGFTAWLFIRDKEKDLNIKGAYLHMAADTLVSVGVVISGITIQYTGWYIIDPVIGIIIGLIIIYSTWRLLKDSLRLSLDGVPVKINLEEIGQVIASTEGVKGFHHIHIWAISTTENAITVHVELYDLKRMDDIKCELKHKLHNKGITHTTIEFELTGKHCEEECF